MKSYKELYFDLFRALSKATSLLDDGQPEAAHQVLIIAQQNAEDAHLEADVLPETANYAKSASPLQKHSRNKPTKREKHMEFTENTPLNLAAKGRRIKVALILTAVVAVMILAVVGVIRYQARQIDRLKLEVEELIKQEDIPAIVDPVTPTITLEVIQTELKDIGELATTEYLYTNAAKFTDSKKIKNWNVGITEKSFILKWDGCIKAGIDIEQLTTALDDANKCITVYLPAAKILSHDIDEDTVELLTQKNGLFNPVKLDDKIQFDAEMAAEMESRAVENGLLDKANTNAKNIITELLNANPVIQDVYSIEFKELPA